MAAAQLMEPIYDAEKLNYQIFSAIESLFLFGSDDPRISPAPATTGSGGGRIRILSVDAADGCLFAAACLARLESSIRRRSGDPAARISDYFDLAAGSGAGGFLAAMLFTRGPDGLPLFSAGEALRFVARNRRRNWGFLRAALCRRPAGGIFRQVFGDATLRDAVKPVLIPCYDLETGSPFVFSRADAMEADGFDFWMSEVCAAACADPGAGRSGSAAAVRMASVDGRTRIAAVGGGIALGNPAAAAVTHVLNNRRDFPLAACVEDLLVVSIGSGEAESGGTPTASPSRAQIVRIAGRGDADLVDQTLAMAFGKSRSRNYLRIQASGIYSGGRVDKLGGGGGDDPMKLAEEVLAQRNIDSVLFTGRKLSEQTNGERLEWFSGEVVMEQEQRRKSADGGAAAAIRQSVSPRTSCATGSTAASPPPSSASSAHPR